MNIEDSLLMRELVSKIKNLQTENKILFSVNYVQIARTNLILLAALLHELKKKGIFVTIDKPHKYMEHLLRIHGVDFSNLLFIDTITGFSGNGLQKGQERGNVRIMSSPFQIELLPEMFSINLGLEARSEGKIDISRMDFILIDNIAAMLNYNREKKVERFLKNYLAKFRNLNNIFIPILIDKEIHTQLYQIAQEMCDMEIEMEMLENREPNKQKESREGSPHSKKKDLLDQLPSLEYLTGGE